MASPKIQAALDDLETQLMAAVDAAEQVSPLLLGHEAPDVDAAAARGERATNAALNAREALERLRSLL